MTDPTAPILITGAGGFVCSEIALALHRAGREVVAVDLAFDAATVRRLEGIERIEGNVPDCLAARGPGAVSAVIHGAAITAAPERLGISRAAHIRRNMDLLTATLDHARDAGAARFLFLSSMGVFAPDDGPASGGLFTEARRPTSTCAYCAAKQAGELLTASAAEPGFATLSLRLGNIFGAHEAVRATRQTLCLVQRMLAEAHETGAITVQTPDALRDWSWLPDLAAAIAGLMDRPWDMAPTIHAGAPPVTSDLSLARAIATRIDGATVRLAPPPHGAVRPPMGTEFPDAFGDISYTGMEAALDMLVVAEIPA